MLGGGGRGAGERESRYRALSRQGGKLNFLLIRVGDNELTK